MTIAVTTTRKDYVGNGALDTYPFDFTVFAAGDVTVHVDSVLNIRGIHYVVTGSFPGPGNVVFSPGYVPALNSAIVIEGNTPQTQATDLAAGQRFYEADIEQGLDKLTILLQQLKNRSFLLPAGASSPGPISILNPVALGYLRLNASMNGLDAVPMAGVPSTDAADIFGIFPDIISKGPWVDIRAFGAIGDGVTDNTAAIQAAIDHLKSLGGGTLFIPLGVWNVSSHVLIDFGGVRVVGAGATYSGPCRVVLTSDNEQAFLVYNHLAPIHGVFFSDFSIESDVASGNPAGCVNRTGILLQGGYDAEHGSGIITFGSIERMHFRGLTRGIHMYDNTRYPPSWMIDGFKIMACKGDEVVSLIEIDAGNATNIFMDSCAALTWGTAAGAGFLLTKAGSVYLHHCEAGCAAGKTPQEIMAGDAGWGIKIVSCKFLTIARGFYSEGCRGLLYQPTGGAFSYDFMIVAVGAVLCDVALYGSCTYISNGCWSSSDHVAAYDGVTKFCGNGKIYSTHDRFEKTPFAVDNAAGYAAGAGAMHVDGLNWPFSVGERFTINGEAPVNGVKQVYEVTVAGAWSAAVPEQDITFTPNLVASVLDNAACSKETGWRLEDAADTVLVRDGFLRGVPGAGGSMFPAIFNNVLVKAVNTVYANATPNPTGNYQVSVTLRNQSAGAHVTLNLFWIDEDSNICTFVVDDGTVARAAESFTYPSVVIRPLKQGSGGISVHGSTDGAADSAKVSIRIDYLPEHGDAFDSQAGI